MPLKHKIQNISKSLLLLLCLGSYPCFGDFSGLQFQNYNKKNSGLSLDSVWSVSEDRDGYIWGATEYGFGRFNGIEFQTLSQLTGKEFGSKFDVTIKQLFFDSKDNIWIATLTEGIYKLGISSLELEAYSDRNNDNHAITSGYIRCVLEDDKNNIWIATSRGINRYNLVTGEMTRVTSHELFGVDIQINYLDYTPWDNLLSVVTKKGVYYFDLNSGNITNMGGSDFSILQNKDIWSVKYDGINNLWLGSGNKLYYYDYSKRRLEEFKFPRKIKNNRYIYSMDVDKSGILWVGIGNEIFAIDVHRHSFLWSYPISFSEKKANEIYNIYVSSNRQLWISTSNTGIWKANLAGQMFGVFAVGKSNNDNQISHNVAVSIHEDQSGNPWIAGPVQGLNHYDFNRDIWKFYSTPFFVGQDEKYKSMGILDITGDLNNNMFLSVKGKIIKFTPISSNIIEYIPNQQYAKSNKYYNKVQSMLYDSKHRLWMYNKPHLISYANVKTGRVKYFDSFKKVWSADIFETESKDILLVTDKGLWLFDENQERFSLIPVKLENQIDPSIISIAESPSGILWLGTDYGLIKYNVNSKTSKLYTKNDGLSNNIIAGILPGGQDDLWLSTFDGLNKLNYISEKFVPFYVEDGVPDNEFETGVIHKAKSGRMYFGGPSGIVYFKPENIKINNNPPKIDLAKLEISNTLIYSGADDNPLPTGKLISDINHLELNYKQNEAKIQFNAIDYYAPKRIKYKYKINGYHDDWVETDYKDRTVRISNFDPGTYTLHIKAGNHHNVWNEEGRKLHITILPPPWKTWWAYTLYILFAIISLWSLYTYRTRQLQQRALELQQEVDKQTEELKEQKTQLEAQNDNINQLIQAKDEIFANISHELKTPLTLITGPLKAMTKKARERKEAEELNMIQRNAYRLLRMVDQLLELSKLQQAKQSIDDQESLTAYVPLHDIIKTTAPFKHTAAAKGITFEIKENEEALVYCQQDFLEKIILNLTNNAIKYTLDGSIKISSQWHDDKTVVIKVKDTGMGIPDDKIDTIFDRFTRVHDVENQQKTIAGAGIGLSLVKELVDKLGGHIDVKSKLGEGSEFSVYLPAVKPDSPGIKYNSVYLDSVENITVEIGGLSEEMHHELDAADQAASTEQSLADTGKEYTLLIIDDNADIRNYVSSIFKSTHNIYTAANGAEGIKIAEKEIPDLIISDVMMPEQDGFHVCQHLKNREMTSHIPIILLTALHDKDSRLRGLRQHANAYMTKPFDPEELKVQVENQIVLRDMINSHSVARLIPDPVNKKAPATPAQNPKDIQFLEKFKKILDEEYTDAQLNMLHIASKMAISDRQLQRKIKAVTGKKPVEYLREYRIEKSLELIKTGRSMEHVAYETGFSTRNYFTNCFRAVMGESPTQYQKRFIADKASIQ